MNEYGLPEAFEEDLDRMALLEGSVLFRCGHCESDFKTLDDWARHSLAVHGEDCLLETVPIN